jgi:hypothetical protein
MRKALNIEELSKNNLRNKIFKIKINKTLTPKKISGVGR